MQAMTTKGFEPFIACPIIAAASPPSASAPSPPMITMPSRSGSATQSPVSMSGAARASVFWIEKLVPNDPTYIE